MNGKRKFIVVRHGSRVQGVRPAWKAPLTPTGAAQAETAAKLLAAMRPQLGLVLVAYSGYIRSWQTIEPLMKIFPVEPMVDETLFEGPVDEASLIAAYPWHIYETVIACGHLDYIRLLLELAGEDWSVMNLDEGEGHIFELDLEGAKLRYGGALR